MSIQMQASRAPAVGVRFGIQLLAGVVLATALVIGLAGLAAVGDRPLDAPAAGTVSLGVPYPGGVAGPSQLPQTLQGVPYPGGVAGPSQLTRNVLDRGAER